MRNVFVAVGLAAALMASGASGVPPRSDPEYQRAVSLVGQVRRADYAGDRDALARLESELTPLAKRESIRTRIHYWRGFALWRRAINGVNDSADPGDLRRDLERAVEAFESTLSEDTVFVDGQLASASCRLFLAFLDRADSARAGAHVPAAVRRLRQAKVVDPENPRLLWVLGASDWYRAAGRDSGERAAFATYERGLVSARRRKAAVDALEPDWGEPELLMNLAWSHLHARVPDLDAAERRAREALALVPNWHYVRDILIPQIAEARASAPAEVESMELPAGMSLYYLGLIRLGPNRSPQVAAEAERLQEAHIANIVRLGKQGKMVVAGPFMDDGDLRGIFVFRVASLREAQELTATDPAVAAGRLAVELHPWLVKDGVLPDSLR